MRRTLAIVVLVLTATGLLHGPVSRWWRAGQLLTHLSSALGDTSAGDVNARPPDLLETNLQIPGADRPIEARLYREAGASSQSGVVIAHGVHYQGIDERRLVVFARALAHSGVTVLTPKLADLSDYRVTPQSVEVIAAAARYLGGRQDVCQSARVGVIGFSFAGGLALVAAADPRAAEHFAYVVSVGGHHDLERVMRFLISNEVTTPDGAEPLTAHEYGLVVAVYERLPELVPEADRATMKAAFRAWLEEDRDRARALAEGRVTPEGDHLFRLLESQRLAELRPRLERILDAERGSMVALSPAGRLRAVGVPVYLLHGDGDTVIPPSEARWASLELGASPHELLVTPLIEHVAISETPVWQQKAELVHFMSRLL